MEVSPHFSIHPHHGLPNIFGSFLVKWCFKGLNLLNPLIFKHFIDYTIKSTDYSVILLSKGPLSFLINPLKYIPHEALYGKSLIRLSRISLCYPEIFLILSDFNPVLLFVSEFLKNSIKLVLTKMHNNLKQTETTYKDLKQPTTNKKQPETTYNEQETI